MEFGNGWCVTYDSAEKLVDLTHSLFASVVDLGNAAASGGQHFVANQASCEGWDLAIEGMNSATGRKTSAVVVESLRHSYRRRGAGVRVGRSTFVSAVACQGERLTRARAFIDSSH